MSRVHECCSSVSSAVSTPSLLMPLQMSEGRPGNSQAWADMLQMTNSLIRKILFLLCCMSLSELLDLSSFHWEQFNRFNHFRVYERWLWSPVGKLKLWAFAQPFPLPGRSAFQLSTEALPLRSCLPCLWDPVRMSPSVLSLLPNVILTFTLALSMSQMFASHT